MALLEVADLRLDFGRRRRVALDGIGFSIEPGQRLGLIGESGSGKSVTALAVMGLLPDHAHLSGSIRLRNRELVGLGDTEYSRLRGDAVSMVFQEPMTALDPTMKLGRQVAEVLRLHHAKTQSGLPQPARDRVLEILREVGLDEPERVADAFPHQLSGGQRQRVLIAMALINTPELIIFDEPTTALDVTVQARVLRLIDEELTKVGSACLFISHDLGVVARVCSEVMVMYHGVIVESGPAQQVFNNPQHPYTRGLVATARLDLVPPGQRLPTVQDFLNAGEVA
jgi:ABC-type dipeptide/oligopeptide/nickel transport system ATPase component